MIEWRNSGTAWSIWKRVLDYAKNRCQANWMFQDRRCPHCGTWASEVGGFSATPDLGGNDTMRCEQCGKPSRWHNEGAFAWPLPADPPMSSPSPDLAASVRRFLDHIAKIAYRDSAGLRMSDETPYIAAMRSHLSRRSDIEADVLISAAAAAIEAVPHYCISSTFAHFDMTRQEAPSTVMGDNGVPVFSGTYSECKTWVCRQRAEAALTAIDRMREKMVETGSFKMPEMPEPAAGEK